MAVSSLVPVPGAARARLGAATGIGPDASAEPVLRALAAHLQGLGAVAPTFADALVAREAAYPTGLPLPVPVAIPHAEPDHVLRGGVAVATLAHPARFGEMGASGRILPVRLVVAILVTDVHAHVGDLAVLLERLRDPGAVAGLLDAPDDATLEARVHAWLSGGGAPGPGEVPGAAASRR